jgi:uncharacterized RDD family membrane protein YckC
MKCPKCEYLGFETGDRCKNCGYDFSMLAADDVIPDLDLQTHDETSPAPDAWLKELDQEFGIHQADDSTIDPFAPATPTADDSIAPTRVSDIAPTANGIVPTNDSAIVPTRDGVPPTRVSPVATAADSRNEPALPLFPPGRAGDDEPLIRLPAAPRAPLAVRRTPDAQRLRAFARSAPRESEPGFEFVPAAAERGGAAALPVGRARAVAAGVAASGAWARLQAVAIDHAILLAIDASVVYFTLKIAALTLADWRLVPLAPLMAFLLLLKFTYFSAFTAVGGQTIGKMGSGIRVIADDGTLVDPSRAVRRTLAGAVSLLTLGAGFAPAIFGADRRALHDRLAHTRVVTL